MILDGMAMTPIPINEEMILRVLPTSAARSSLEGDVLHLGPQGTRQLSAQSHRLASQFLLLCRGVSAQTQHPTKDRGTVIQQK